MKLNNKTIEDWLVKPPKASLHNGKSKDYYSPYKTLKDRLIAKHRQVTAGGTLKNPELFLNDHGPEHIETVIGRATSMIKDSKCNLTAKEVYFLLVAIQIHDLGNMLGRYEHEVNALDVVAEHINLVGEDNIERKMIKDIAEAHGGKIKGSSDKDKITKLNPVSHTLGEEIRVQLLASILRFADELADDKTRCDKDLLILNKLPKGSEVFHAYAHCLDSVLIRHSNKQIELKFKIPQDFAERQFGKWNNEKKTVEDVYLLDEIYERALKMHFERIYTTRFMRDFINLESILVFIDFYNEKLEVFDPISFELRETGYPTSSHDIFQLCPTLTKGEKRIDGEFVKNGGMKSLSRQ
jgi:hypothetical protein